MLILVGVQLGLFWVIIRVLDELRERQLAMQANHGLAS